MHAAGYPPPHAYDYVFYAHKYLFVLTVISDIAQHGRSDSGVSMNDREMIGQYMYMLVTIGWYNSPLDSAGL